MRSKEIYKIKKFKNFFLTIHKIQNKKKLLLMKILNNKKIQNKKIIIYLILIIKLV